MLEIFKTALEFQLVLGGELGKTNSSKKEREETCGLRFVNISVSVAGRGEESRSLH